MMPWLVIYTTFLVSLFAICTAVLGLNTTVWGFAITFVGCTLASFVLWWRDEILWKETLQVQNSTAPVVPLPLQSVTTETPISTQNLQQNQDWAPLEDSDFDLLATYTQDLTARVAAVYPLVDRDHIHKIVWAVMIELFCKRMNPSSHVTPASIISERIARVA